MTIQKSSMGILRLAKAKETLEIIGSEYGRGVVTWGMPQQTANRTAVSGRSAVRPLGVFRPFVSLSVRDNEHSAELLGWFWGNGQQYDVDWRPAGDGSGLAKITFTGDMVCGLEARADRTRTLRITANGNFTDGIQ